MLGNDKNVVARNQTAGLTSALNGCQWGMGIFVQSGVSTFTGECGHFDRDGSGQQRA